MSSLKIKGLQKTSLIDYEPHICCVVFLAGCNFRCGFCHNPDLIVNADKTPDIDEKELFDFLEKRKGWLDAVCITGGEPCLNNNLVELIKKIKDLGHYKVKLDTNGTYPKILKELIKDKLIDYVALDIKGPLEKYDKIANAKVDKESIKKSVSIIMKSGIDYEFRMTAIPTLIEKEDFKIIGRWLKGAKKLFIQQFKNRDCLDESFEKIKPFSKVELLEFKKILDSCIAEVVVRE